MPGVIGNILIGMGVSTSGLDKGFGRASSQTKSFAAEIQGIGASLRNTVVAGLAGAGIAGTLVKAAKAASDLNEQLSAAGVVFGKSAGVVTAEADRMADRFGIVKSEFIENANSLGSLFTAIGKTQDESASLSAQFVKLAIDLSSIRNVPVQDALMAIRSGLVGEAEPLRKFGVLLSEAAVAAEAVRMGLSATGKSLTEQQKVQARMSLITQGLAYANGDLARTFDGVANQARSAAGRWTNAMAELGKAFEPVSQGLLNLGSQVVTFLTEKIKENQASWVEWAKGVGESFKTVAADGHSISDFFGGLMRVGLVIRGVIRGVAGALAYLISGAAGLLANLLNVYDAIQRQFTGKDSQLAASVQAFRDELKKQAIETGASVLSDFNRAFADNQPDTPSRFVGSQDAKGVGASWAAAGEEAAGAWTKVGETVKSASDVATKAADAQAEQMKRIEAFADAAKKHEEGLASAAKSLIDQTTTPAEKLRDETMKIREMLGKGYIDQTTAARGLLAARSEAGIGKVQYAGAMEAGSVEARSALLAANGQATRSDDGLSEIAKGTRDTAASNARSEQTLQRMEAMLRQFIGTAAGPQTVRFGS